MALSWKYPVGMTTWQCRRKEWWSDVPTSGIANSPRPYYQKGDCKGEVRGNNRDRSRTYMKKQINHRWFEKLTLAYENQNLTPTKLIHPSRDTHYPSVNGYWCYYKRVSDFSGGSLPHGFGISTSRSLTNLKWRVTHHSL